MLTNITITDANIDVLNNIDELEHLHSVRLDTINVDCSIIIEKLCDIKSIRHLSIYNCKSVDWSGLSQLPTLTYLYLHTLNADNILFVSNLTNLKYFHILYSKDIHDISPIATLSNLEEFEWRIVTETNIRCDISVLKSLPNIRELSLAGHVISDITPIQYLTKLRSLVLSNIKCGTIQFEKLVNLETLFVYNIENTDFSETFGLSNLSLTQLEIKTDIPLKDYSFLKNLKSLSWIRIDHISDLSVLESSKDTLNYLESVNGELIDLSLISKFHNLTCVVLKCKEIVDITPLSTLTCLKRLTLSDNKITDITPLNSLLNLVSLNVDGNPIVYGC
jgi:internalin A